MPVARGRHAPASTAVPSVMLSLTDSDNVQEDPGEIEVFWPVYEGTFPITPSCVIGLVRWPPVLVLVLVLAVCSCVHWYLGAAPTVPLRMHAAILR
jgi:hypothetical protein